MALPNIDFDSTSYADGLELVKSAGLEEIKDSLMQYFADNPELAGSLKRMGIGAAGGAGLGALSSLAQRPGRRTPWQRALTGGIIGGGGTAAAEQLYNALQEGGAISRKGEAAGLEQQIAAPAAGPDLEDYAYSPFDDKGGLAATGAAGAAHLAAKALPKGRAISMGEQMRGKMKGSPFDADTALGAQGGDATRKAFATVNSGLMKHFGLSELQAGELIRKHGTKGAWEVMMRKPRPSMKATGSFSGKGRTRKPLSPSHAKADTAIQATTNAPGRTFQRPESTGVTRPWRRMRTKPTAARRMLGGKTGLGLTAVMPWLYQGGKKMLGGGTPAWSQGVESAKATADAAAKTRLGEIYPQ